MGKEWLYWGGSGSGSGSGNGNGTSNRSTQRGRRTKGEEVIHINNEEAPPPPGCMCFQIFDLPHFQLALNQQSRSLKPHHPSFLQQDQKPSFLKGLEAPRNSLELDEPLAERKSVSSSLSSSSTMKVDEQNLNIPVGIQIRTSCGWRSPRVSTSGSRTRTDDISSECSSSSPAGTKTPTLVARLMGLDLLPENNSPRISISTCNTKSQSKNIVVNNNHQYSNSKNRRRFSSFESSDTNYITGTLSLPETPRISSARRSDVDHHHYHQQQQNQYHHRLSLQINNKENMGDVFEFSDSSIASVGRKMARSSSRRRSFHQQENENQTRSPGYYARQIVKQVKESVSRKVGHDITNTSTSGSIRRKDDQLAAKYDQVVLLKPKKPSKSHGDHDDFSTIKQTTPSCSPRFRFLESKSSTSTKHQPVNSSAAKNQTSHSPRFLPLSPLAENSTTTLPAKIVTKPAQTSQKEQVQQKSTIQKRKGEKLVPKKPPQACDAIRSKKEEPFVRSANFADKKCKKTPLSNQLVNNTVPTILPLRKDPSPPPTKLPIKQSESQESDTYPSKRNSSTELSSSSSQSYYKLTTVQEINRDKCNGAATTTTPTISGDALQFHQYIQRILKRTGLYKKSTPLSLANCYSPSHPLDPSIFHYLELFTAPNYSNLTLRCNRKLIFHLVDELLVDILIKPCVGNFKQHCQLMHGGEEELIDALCARIRSFPSANCQVLEDIDTLIDKDMQKSEVSGILPSEEVEIIVCEIERDIMEQLVHDTVCL